MWSTSLILSFLIVVSHSDSADDDFDDTKLEKLRSYYRHLSEFEDLTPGEQKPTRGISSYGAYGKVSPKVLSMLITKMWNEDSNSFDMNQDFRVNTRTKLQHNQVSKVSAGKLYDAFDSRIVQASTYRTFLPLLDNYNPETGQPERTTQKELSEINAFLNSIINTKVMQIAWQFLSSNNLVPQDKKAFKEYLADIWFSLYSRHKGVMDSSGFEHVFVGEFKKGEVTGLHNWVRLYQLQYFNQLNYKGYFSMKPPGLMSVQFHWMNRMKPKGSFFLGTSPEFEMALYTLCFLTRPNGPCEFAVNNQRVRIITYQLNQGQRRARVGTSFPV